MAIGGLAFDNTIGALLIGTSLSMVLLGVVFMQAYLYYVRYPGDRLWTKLLVATVVVMEIGQAVSANSFLYYYSVTHFGEPEKLIEKAPTSLPVDVICSALIAPVVQAFFARRVLVLSRSSIIPVVCWVLSFARFVGYVGAVYGTATMTGMLEFQAKYLWLVISLLVVGAFIDILIAVTMCILLFKQKRKAMTGLEGVMNNLILFAVETGLATSVTEIAFIAAYLSMKHNFVWLGIFMLLPRMFSNSLLASLNARHGLREAISNRDVVRSNEALGSSHTGMSSGAIAIKMTRVTEAEGLAYHSDLKGSTPFVDARDHV